MTKPLQLYFWATPNGWKITIMLEECGLPYEIQYVNLGAGEQLKDDFLAISPNGRMPALVDPDGPGGTPISIFESGAILQYLGNKTGQFYPKGQRERSEVEQWLFWQMAGLGPMAGQAAHFRYLDEEQTYPLERYTGESRRLYEVMNTRLADREYLAGEYSIADMACWPWIRGYKALHINLEELPYLRRWFKQVGGRDAVQRAANIGKEEFKKDQEVRNKR